jgi:hypothetical protein
VPPDSAQRKEARCQRRIIIDPLGRKELTHLKPTTVGVLVRVFAGVLP